MPIVLFRVDERLIHGQVVVGWGGRLHPDRVVVVDDALADSAWEQELYCLGVPPEMEASFVSVERAAARLPVWQTSSHRFVVLLRDVETLHRLAAAVDLRDVVVNLGGIHHSETRERVLPYLHLGDAEREQLTSLEAAGLRITAQDLPASRAVPLSDLLP